MKKILTKISIFGDILKDFLIAVIVIVLILLVTLSIVHNILKVNEVSSKYSGEYKNLVKVEDKMMNVYSIGSGEQTIVILSGFGIQSPVLEYKSLAKNLSENYRVVIVEYFGYGFSAKAKNERTSTNIAREVREALASAGIQGPYILMPHSLSNIYAIKYQKLFPEDVKAIVSIDGTLPNMISEQAYIKEINETRTNIRITSIAELTGFARIMSYVKPEVFFIDKMQNDVNYNYSDIELYRRLIGISYLTNSMVKEANKMEENIKAEKDFIYSKNLPVLEILTSETIKRYELQKDYEEYANDLITNSSIQKVMKIEGDHMIPITNPSDLALMIKDFVGTYIY